MKFIVLLVLSASLTPGDAAIFAANSGKQELGFASGEVEAKDRPITKVVKLLQSMLDKSKADGDSERVLYAKFKCYCDTNKDEKEQAIDTLTTQIALFGNEIERLQSDTSVLSTEVAGLKKEMEKNKASQDEAESLRTKENTEFVALKADLEGAIGQIKDAIETLSEVGSDQALGEAAADHDTYMAGYTPGQAPPAPTFLLNLKSLMKQALVSASTKVTHSQAKRLDALLQTPFTGTYTSQSAEVVGILKDMEDTFQQNLDTAVDQEAKAVEAHGKYMTAMQDAWDAMKKSSDEKQGTLSANDDALGTQRKSLETAVQQKEDAESFLMQLNDQCAGKAKEYDARVMLRANEEAAIAEAISILNSDSAFETFGKVSATSVPTFLQMKSRKLRHTKPVEGQEMQRQRAIAFLRGEKGAKQSGRIVKIMTLIAANNPFTVVLAEIQKMIDLIGEEEKVDDQQLAWCTGERTTNNANLQTKITEIQSLEGQISVLDDTINNPQTGLKAVIKDTEASLVQNGESQTSETTERREDNLEYQKSIAHLQEADALLTKAVSVLKNYYNQISPGAGGAAFIAAKKKHDAAKLKEDPAPPSTWSGDYKGQGGSSAIEMVEYILEGVKKEENLAHESEQAAQHAYEDSMQKLKADEEDFLRSLASSKESLATSEEEMQRKGEEKKATENEKEAIEAYLLKIKPGCDFITDNIATRKAHRKTETGALQGAIDFLKASPAYIGAVAQAHNESLGDCLDTCAPNEAHVDCKACMAKVSVPGYCAGHPGTVGC